MAKRDGKYYLRRLKDEHPAVFSDYQAGHYPSVNAAARAAGLKQQRTRLHELKNAWNKASLAERQEFLRWLPATITPKAASHVSGTVAVDRYLEPWAKARIATIMAARNMKIGDVMHEMGFKKLNASLGHALTSPSSRLQPAVILALEKWVHANRAI